MNIYTTICLSRITSLIYFTPVSYKNTKIFRYISYVDNEVTIIKYCMSVKHTFQKHALSRDALKFKKVVEFQSKTNRLKTITGTLKIYLEEKKLTSYKRIYKIKT